MSRQYISGHPEHPCDGIGESVPVFGFDVELSASGGCQGIEPRPAAKFRDSPLGFDPAAVFEAMKGWIQRALVYLQDILRDLLDALGDGPSMHSSGSEGSQNQKIKRALQQIESGFVLCH